MPGLQDQLVVDSEEAIRPQDRGRKSIKHDPLFLPPHAGKAHEVRKAHISSTENKVAALLVYVPEACCPLCGIKEHLTGEKSISFGHCPNYLSTTLLWQSLHERSNADL